MLLDALLSTHPILLTQLGLCDIGVASLSIALYYEILWLLRIMDKLLWYLQYLSRVFFYWAAMMVGSDELLRWPILAGNHCWIGL